MTDSTATTGMPTDDARALADDLHEFIAAAPHNYPGHIVELFERCEAALRRTAPVAGRDREAIAKIINPQVFTDNPTIKGKMRERQYALERADAILALPAGRVK